MGTMKHQVIVVLLLAVGWLQPAASAPPQQDAAKVDYGTEIFHAVLEGLYDDGVSNAALDLILRKEKNGMYSHFVRACPTCAYVVEAMRHYRARPPFVSFKPKRDTWGAGLSKDLCERLAHSELKVRLDAVHTLVSRWIDTRMDRLRLNKSERAAWTLELRRRAKKGMSMLGMEQEREQAELWGDLACPSCEGAVAGAVGK